MSVIKKYLNDTQTARLWAKIKAGFVAKSGDTMTGALTLAGDPVSDLQAATKKYVDDNAGALPSQTGQGGKFLTTDGTDASWGTVDALPSQSGKNGKYLKTNGTAASWEDSPEEIYYCFYNVRNQSNTTYQQALAAYNSGYHLVLKTNNGSDYYTLSSYVINSEFIFVKLYPELSMIQVYTLSDSGWSYSYQNYVKSSGDTMTGALTLSGAPTSDLHAATKKYVDDYVGDIETLLASI